MQDVPREFSSPTAVGFYPSPLRHGFHTGAWTYRALFPGIRPPEREGDRSELVSKLRRLGVLHPFLSGILSLCEAKLKSDFNAEGFWVYQR